MREVVIDAALRLEYQMKILQRLDTLVKEVASHSPFGDNPKYADFLQATEKSLHNVQVLHKDTLRQSVQLVQVLPEGESNTSSTSNTMIAPLLVRQLGQTFKEICARHSMTIESMAEIVIDMRPILRDLSMPDITTEFQHWIQAFLKSRLMTQLLCDHIVDCTMHAHRKPHGAVSVDLSVAHVLEAASSEAYHLVDAHYVADPPAIIILSNTRNGQDEDDIVATVIRPWLQYALVEILKNALAMTVERECYLLDDFNGDGLQYTNNDDDDETPFCPIYVAMEETEHNIFIHVMDQAGGLTWGEESKERRRTNDELSTTTTNIEPHLLEWEFANRQSKWDRMDDQWTYAMVRSPVRGLGVGLSLSQWQLEHFGGSLRVTDRCSMTEWSASNGDKIVLQPGMTATIGLNKDFEKLEVSD